MQGFKRYAIYYAPEPGPLAEFGARWLGWNPEAGNDLPHLPSDLPLDQITRTPRKYGLHGTIKPPFRLAQGIDIGALHATTRALVAGIKPIRLDGLRLARIGGFLALVPDGDASALSAMAGNIVKALDPFRAPLTEAEIAKRRPDRLTDNQRQMLDQFGYPYVLDEFRFHLTLSGRLDPDLAAQTEAELDRHLTDILPRPFVIRSLCLFGEADNGCFHLLHRYDLTP